MLINPLKVKPVWEGCHHLEKVVNRIRHAGLDPASSGVKQGYDSESRRFAISDQVRDDDSTSCCIGQCASHFDTVSKAEVAKRRDWAFCETVKIEGIQQSTARTVPNRLMQKKLKISNNYSFIAWSYPPTCEKEFCNLSN